MIGCGTLREVLVINRIRDRLRERHHEGRTPSRQSATNKSTVLAPFLDQHTFGAHPLSLASRFREYFDVTAFLI
jgi:hypothetical protein